MQINFLHGGVAMQASIYLQGKGISNLVECLPLQGRYRVVLLHNEVPPPKVLQWVEKRYGGVY